jgi:hypothetical protein
MNADQAIARLHELVALAHDAVIDVYSATPTDDNRFRDVDVALSDVETMIRKLRNGTYVEPGRVATLRSKIA